LLGREGRACDRNQQQAKHESAPQYHCSLPPMPRASSHGGSIASKAWFRKTCFRKTWAGKTSAGKTWAGKTWAGKTWAGKTAHEKARHRCRASSCLLFVCFAVRLRPAGSPRAASCHPAPA
jgi:hypothetical protein